MKRREKNLGVGEETPVKLADPNGLTSSRDGEERSGLNTMRVMGAFVACLMILSVFFSLSVVLRDPPSDGIPPNERVHEVNVISEKGNHSSYFMGICTSVLSDFLGGKSRFPSVFVL